MLALPLRRARLLVRRHVKSDRLDDHVIAAVHRLFELSDLEQLHLAVRAELDAEVVLQEVVVRLHQALAVQHGLCEGLEVLGGSLEGADKQTSRPCPGNSSR